MKSLAAADKGILRFALDRLRKFAGVLLLVVGAAGLVLPFVPGAVLILAGITMIGANHPRFAPIIDRVRGALHRRLSTKSRRELDSSRASL